MGRHDRGRHEVMSPPGVVLVCLERMQSTAGVPLGNREKRMDLAVALSSLRGKTMLGSGE